MTGALGLPSTENSRPWKTAILHITKQDIDAATTLRDARMGYDTCSECAYAQAVVRQFGVYDLYVDAGGIVVGYKRGKEVYIMPNGDGACVMAERWIDRFDNRDEVEPVSIRVLVDL